MLRWKPHEPVELFDFLQKGMNACILTSYNINSTAATFSYTLY